MIKYKKVTKPVIVLTIVSILLMILLIQSNTMFEKIIKKDEYYSSLTEERKALYDKLKVKNIKITDRKTGTKNFNTATYESVDDGSVVSNMEGIDVSEKDDYVRTFDTISYTLEVNVEENPNANIEEGTILKGGVIKVKATLPKGPNGEVYFTWQEDAWMQNVKTNEDKTILTAEYHISEEYSIVGGNQELSFTVLASGYPVELTEEQHKPIFEVWMEGNLPDNEESKINSTNIYDKKNIFISGKENFDLIIDKGNLNLPTTRKEKNGQYINFEFMIDYYYDNNYSIKGIAFPSFKSGTGKIKVNYYYKTTASETWSLLDENTEKASEVLNNIELIAYNSSGMNNENALPNADSNSNYKLFCFIINNQSLCPEFKTPSASINNNVIEFTMDNIKFPGQKYEDIDYGNNEYLANIPIVSEMFELFIPYYLLDDNDYNYKIEVEILEFKNDSEKNINLDGNLNNNKTEINFNYIKNIEELINMNTSKSPYETSVVMGTSTYTSCDLNVNYGPFEGGEERLISWDSTLIDYSSVKILSASEKTKIKYGIYKANPQKGLNSVEEVNEATLESFNWYDDIEEAKKGGVITSLNIYDSEYKGNNKTNSYYVYLKPKLNANNFLKTYIVRQKAYLYFDEDKKNIISVGDDNNANSYIPNKYENGILVSPESPSEIGETHLISGNYSYAYFHTKNYLGKYANTFEASDEIINIELYLTDNEAFLENNIFLTDDLAATVKLPPELTYLEGTANLEPDFIRKTSTGETYIQWTYKDHLIGEETEKIKFQVEIDQFITNNKQLNIPYYRASLKYAPLYTGGYTYNYEGKTYSIKTNENSYNVERIQISNLSGSSTRKNFDKKYLEKNDSFNVTDSVYNISDAPLQNLKTIQRLPYSKDMYGSNYSGTYKIKITSLATNQRLYYSNNTFEKLGIESDEYGNLSAQNIDFANDSKWIEAKVGDTIPHGATAIASTLGTLSTGTSEKFTYEFITEGNMIHDKYAFRTFMTSDNLETPASSHIKEAIVSDRVISGIVFVDKNNNNIYDNNDTLLKDTEIKLLDSNKNTISTTKTDANGYYKFSNLIKQNYYIQSVISEDYEIVSKNSGLTNNSSVFNSNGYTDIIETLNDELRVEILEADNINLGVRQKEGTLTVNHFIEGTTTELAATTTETVYYGNEYSTLPSQDVSNYYELISTPDNASGIVKSDITVTYYYRLKSAIIIIKHLEKDTFRELDNEIKKDTKYGTYYTSEISPNIPANYDFFDKTSNYEGKVETDLIEIIYYYQKKDSKLDSTISKTGPEELTQKNVQVDYIINYEAKINDYIGGANITITDTLPYEIDEEKSNLDGGVYSKNTNTITWTIKENNIDAGTETKTISINKKISLEFTNIDSTKRTMTNSVSGAIVLDNNERTINAKTITYLKIPGKIIVHHYLKGTTKKIVDDIISTNLVGETYISNGITKDGYVLVSEPENKTHKYTDEQQEIIYEYEKINLNIITKVIGGGGSISGDEVVSYGENSTEGKIIIKPQKGYIVTKITVNGKELNGISCENGCTLDKFEKMLENKTINVYFEKIKNNPETLSLGDLTITIIILICSVIILYKLNKNSIMRI